jgi:hypothetical protein
MPIEDRYCTNCRDRLWVGESTCRACGVFAGDIFDGRMPGQRRRWPWLLGALVLAIALAAGSWFVLRGPLPRMPWRPAPVKPAPIRVVNDRPGGARRGAAAAINEPEAILVLRRYLTASLDKPIKDDCFAVLSHGFRRGAYELDAVNHCDGTRLGRWRVDGTTRAVTRAR